MKRRETPWTDQEKALIEQRREEWMAVGKSTEPVDIPEVQAASAALYIRAGKKPVFTWVVPGPLAAMYALAQWKSGLGKPLTEESPKVQYEYTWFWGQHDAYWVGWYRTAQELGVPFTEEQNTRLGEIERLTKACGWWWPFENGAVAMARPQTLRMVDPSNTGRWILHCEDGPALAYADGFKLYAWHGTRLPGWIIETPEKITQETINAESNAEIRRAMIGKMGADRYVASLNAKPVHTQETALGTEELYRIPRTDDSDLVLARVINPTPEPLGVAPHGDYVMHGNRWYKYYWLRVAPDENIRTVEDARAWSFSCQPEFFILAQET